MQVSQQSLVKSDAVLELERQLRVTHSKMHNAFSSLLFPRRMTENELKIELRSCYKDISDGHQAEAAMAIVNGISVYDLQKAHSEVDFSEIQKASMLLKPSFIQVASPAYSITAPLPIAVSFYESTEENKSAALKLIGLLAEL